MRRPTGFEPARNARNVPPGWELGKMDGKRAARNPEGEVVSYYQYLSAQARVSGFKNHNEYARWREKRAVQATIKAGQAQTPDKQFYALGSDTLKLFRNAFWNEDLTGKSERQLDKNPGGDTATYLEALGVRPRGATYPVGETPRA